MQFGIWLLGQNKKTQEKYWQQLKDSKLDTYQTPPTSQDFVLGTILVEKPDFSNLEPLTAQIDIKTT